MATKKSITARMNIAERLEQIETERRELEEMRDQFDFEARRDDDGINEVDGVVSMSMLG